MSNTATFLKWNTVTKLDMFISLVCVVVLWSFNTILHFLDELITPYKIIQYSSCVFLLIYSLLKCYRYFLRNITSDKHWKIWQAAAFSVDAALLLSAILWLVKDAYTLTTFLTNTLSFTTLILGGGMLAVVIFKKLNHKDILDEPPVKRSEKLTAVYQSERILITGAAGTIGSELTKQLSSLPNVTLLLLDQSELGLQNLMLDCHQCCANLIPVLGDIKNKPQLERLFANHQPTMIFHTAAYKQLPILEQYPAEAVGTNIIGTLNLVDCADTNRVDKFIYISTDKAVNPTSVLGITKKIAEDYAWFKLNQSNHTQWAIVRFGNVLNSNGSVLDVWEQQLKTSAAIEVRDPKASRYFISPQQVAHLLITLASFKTLNHYYLFKMGEAVVLQSLATQFIKTRQWKFIPRLRILQTSLLEGEKQHELLITNKETLKKTAHPLIDEVVTTTEVGSFSIEQLKLLVANYLYIDNQQLKQELKAFYTNKLN